MPPPPVLTIAGSDCSAGAGIQADLKTITSLGGYGLTAVTSVVSETPGCVSQIRVLDPEFITDQIRLLFSAFPIRAAKTGMLGSAAMVRAVADAWRKFGAAIPLVVDPVMVATSGGRLLEDSAVAAMTDDLLPLATLITPNLDEAAVLWRREVKDRPDMEECARALGNRFGCAVLVKGGHLTGDRAADILCTPDGLRWFEAARTTGVNTHGTGCTFSAAIATGLAKGLELAEAVSQAKSFVTRAVAEHYTWTNSTGSVQALNHRQPCN